jgi:hypothetical protein
VGRVYTVPIAATTVTAASGDVDWWEISPADDKPVELLGFVANITSELGDAADEWVPFQVLRGHTTSGSGGSAPTPTPLNPADAAAGFTAEVLNTTIASAGTAVICHADAVNVRSGEVYWWPDKCGPQASQANTTILIRQMAAVTDDVTFTGTLYVNELP